jgi:hypothetical protein
MAYKIKKNFLESLRDKLTSSVGLQTKTEITQMALDTYNNYYKNISNLEDAFINTDINVEKSIETLSDMKSARSSYDQITKARDILERAIDLCITKNHSNSNTSVGAIIRLLNKIASDNQHLTGFSNIVPIINKLTYDSNLLEIKRVITITESELNQRQRI